MEKFDLWFPIPMRSGRDDEAETAFAGKTAYICAVNPFDDGSGQHTLVKSKGRILINNEAASADECCAQIDSLISELQRLKTKARKMFAE